MPLSANMLSLNSAKRIYAMFLRSGGHDNPGRLELKRTILIRICLSPERGLLVGMLTLAVLLGASAGAQQTGNARHVHTKASATKTKAKPTAKTDGSTASGKKAAKAPDKPTLSQDALKTVETRWQKLDPQMRGNLLQLAETLRTENRSVQNELRDDEELAATDIGMLWEAAVERSGSIRYAIEKLSRRDATGKPVESDTFSKRMIQSLVHLGGVAGTMWTGTPAGLIGSGMVQNLISGDPAESALSRVTDADMVILAKEVDSLQTQLITLYYTYRHAQEKLTLSQEATATIAKYFQQAEESQEPGMDLSRLRPLMQYVYENAKRDEQNARQAYQSSRTALALVVGPDALAVLEQSGAKNKRTSSATPSG